MKEIVCRNEYHVLYGYYHKKQSDHHLVLIPGTFAHHSIWEPVIEHADIDANVLLIDLPGFGKSTPRNPDRTIEQLTAQVLEIVDAAGINRFFVGGHSLGGMMAIEMIDLAGGRLDGVISCEGWTHYSVEKNAFDGLKNETLSDEHRRLRQHYKDLASFAWTESDLKMFAGIWKKWDKGRRILDQTDLPVLGLWGDRGKPIRPTREQLQIPSKTNIDIHWVENGGHSMLVQFPDQVGIRIAEFVRSVASRCSG